MTDFLEQWVGRLTSDRAIDALVGDGWSPTMARHGLGLHKQTWHIGKLRAAVAAELKANPDSIETLPSAVVHIWPALPGAGLSPVLFAAAAGIERQWAKVSSRNAEFSRFIIDASEGLLRETPNPFAEDAQTLVVSGSDETVAEVRALAKGRHVVGYGHRVSWGITGGAGAAELATDIVTWHQQGCFSVRAVVFVGSETPCLRFCQELGDAIAREETRLDASLVTDEAVQAHRAQRRAIAEFRGARVFGTGTGWVEYADAPWAGEWISHHAVSVHRIETIEELASVITVPTSNLQGVALAETRTDRDRWANAALTLGATRVDDAGRMQSPPIEWPHDGMPNLGVLAPR